MKKITTSILVLMTVSTCFGQRLPVYEPGKNATADKWMRQSKRSATVAWLLAAGGVVSVVAGVATLPHHRTKTEITQVDPSWQWLLGESYESTVKVPFTAAQKRQEKICNAFIIGGAVMQLSSIPFFIFSKVKSNRARFTLKSEKISSRLPGLPNRVNGFAAIIQLGGRHIGPIPQHSITL